MGCPISPTVPGRRRDAVCKIDCFTDMIRDFDPTVRFWCMRYEASILWRRNLAGSILPEKITPFNVWPYRNEVLFSSTKDEICVCVSFGGWLESHFEEQWPD